MIEDAIKLESITKTYGAAGGFKRANDGISLSIKKGSIFGILGPNGAGKSTLINIIATAVKKTSGKVYIFGKDMDADLEFCKMKIGTAMQEMSLDPFVTVKEYLVFTAGYYGIEKRAALNRIEEVCVPLGLMEHLSKNTRALSGGMRRRLLIAKALMHNPDIIILDEPTAGVDIELRNSLWEYMVRLNKEQGKTILLTTHYLQEAESFCDEIAFINGGKIVLQDKKESILKRILSKKISLIFERDIDTKLFCEHNCDIEKSLTDEGRFKIDILYKTDGFEVFSLIKLLVEKGLVFSDVTTSQATLDDIFISIFKNEKL